MRFEFIADEHVKVKTFLKKHEISKALLAKVKFAGGNILVNGQSQNAIYLLDIGDKVTVDERMNLVVKIANHETGKMEALEEN